MSPAVKRRRGSKSADPNAIKNAKPIRKDAEISQDDAFDSDDSQDLMASASQSHYKDSESENDDWESQSDEDMEVEQVSESMTIHDATAGEAEGLKETADLYKSNLFKLEIDELLAEIRVPHNKQKSVETTLHHLKSIMDGMKNEQEVLINDAKKKLKKKGVTVPFPQPGPSSDAQYKFKFEKPSDVRIVGSYALKMAALIKGHFVVDMAVVMPTSMFQEKDFMNHRYFYKRALYLASIAVAIMASNTEYQLEFSAFNGDERRPTLLVHSKDKSKYTIRILPCVVQDLFTPHRLAPSRNNVRAKDETLNTLATPLYNAAVLSETTILSNLAFLYDQTKICPAFADAVLLAKVWLFQRGLCSADQTGSGVNAFLFAMLMAYLLHGGEGRSRKLSPGLSSYQLLRGTLDFIAQHDFKKPIAIGRSESQELSLEAFKEHYDVVVVDPSGVLNLAAEVSHSGISQLQFEAIKAMQYLNDTVDRFDTLFLQHVDDLTYRYDHILSIPVPKVQQEEYHAIAKAERPLYVDYLASHMDAILEKGLTDRAELVVVRRDAALKWPLSSNIPSQDNQQQITVGLVLNGDNAGRLLDQGPDPQNKEESSTFKQFWGSKAELRRFKDGSILESVVWEAKGYEQRTLIVQRIIFYLFKLHLGLDTTQCHYWAGQLYPYIHLSPRIPTDLFHREREIEGFAPVMNAYTQFSKGLRDIDTDLPLQIHGVYPAASGLRFASVLAPQPTPFDNISSYPTSARYIEVMDVMVQLERSSKWPDDMEALQNVKRAFYLKMSQLLHDRYDLQSVLIDDVQEPNPLARRGYLDVYYSGYVFRCHLQVAQEPFLLRNIIQDEKESKERKELAGDALDKYEHDMTHRQSHTYSIQTLSTRHSALSSTMRLVKRWFACHLLAPQVPEELIELICAHVFVEPHPWHVPASALAGFARVICLLATWNWREQPLCVNVDGEMTAADRDAITKAFTIHRSRHPHMTMGAMFVATSKDATGLQWSKQKPTKAVAARIQVLAKASCHALEEAIGSNTEKDLKRLFATPLQGYNAIIHLKKSRNTRYYQSLSPDAKHLPTLLAVASELPDEVLAGFDPVADFVRDLERLYGPSLLVFYDPLGGDKLALVWDPSLLQPKSWKINAGYNSIPVDIKSDGTLVPSKGEKAVSKLMKANVPAILAEIERLGAGLVKKMDVS